MNDIILTPDGRSVYWLNPVFYGVPVRESQIIQERVDQLRVLVVPAVGFRAETARSIVDRLQARVGRVDIQVESVEAIPRTAGGKFRAVVNLLPLPAPANTFNVQ